MSKNTEGRIDRIVALLLVCLYIALIPFYPLIWAMCRITARRCPNCGSKCQTELIGEWDCEMWKCHRCGHDWDVVGLG